MELIALFQYLKESYGEDRDSLFEDAWQQVKVGTSYCRTNSVCL